MRLLIAVLTFSSVCIASGFGEEVDNGLKAIQENGELLHNADNLPLINNINPSRTIRDAEPKKKNKKSKAAKKGKKGNKKGKRKGKKIQKKKARKAKKGNRKGKRKGKKVQKKKGRKAKNKKNRKGKKAQKKKKGGKKKSRKGRKGKKGKKNKKNKSKKKGRKAKRNKKKGDKKSKKKSKKLRKDKKIKGKSKKGKGKKRGDKGKKFTAKIQGRAICPGTAGDNESQLRKYLNNFKQVSNLKNKNNLLQKKYDKADNFLATANYLGGATNNGETCNNPGLLEKAKTTYKTLSNCSNSVKEYCLPKYTSQGNINEIESCRKTLDGFIIGFTGGRLLGSNSDTTGCLQKGSQDAFCTCLDALTTAGPTCLGFYTTIEREVVAQYNQCKSEDLRGSFRNCRQLQRDAVELVAECGGNTCVQTTSSPGATTASRGARLLRNFRFGNNRLI